MAREYLNAAVCDVARVNRVDDLHRRRRPRMLMKKLDRIVWNPSATSVTPGITPAHGASVIERTE